MLTFFPFSIGQWTGHATAHSGLPKMKTWRPFLSFSGENALFLHSLDIKKHFDDIWRAILVQYLDELLFVCSSDVRAAVVLRTCWYAATLTPKRRLQVIVCFRTPIAFTSRLKFIYPGLFTAPRVSLLWGRSHNKVPPVPLCLFESLTIK